MGGGLGLMRPFNTCIWSRFTTAVRVCVQNVVTCNVDHSVYKGNSSFLITCGPGHTSPCLNYSRVLAYTPAGNDGVSQKVCLEWL